jgi:hypothetical protein
MHAWVAPGRAACVWGRCWRGRSGAQPVGARGRRVQTYLWSCGPCSILLRASVEGSSDRATTVGWGIRQAAGQAHTIAVICRPASRGSPEPAHRAGGWQVGGRWVCGRWVGGRWVAPGAVHRCAATEPQASTLRPPCSRACPIERHDRLQQLSRDVLLAPRRPCWCWLPGKSSQGPTCGTASSARPPIVCPSTTASAALLPTTSRATPSTPAASFPAAPWTPPSAVAVRSRG